MSVRSPLFVVLSTSVLPVGACGGDSNDPDQLVGTWREIPSQVQGPTPPEERDLLTLTADGRYDLVERDGLESGAYTADARDLTVTSGPDSIRVQYVVTEDRLMISALLPDGDVEGVVGMWAGDARLNDEELTLAIDVRDDATAHYERTSTAPDGAGDESYDGTWRFEVDDLVITFELPTDGGGTFTVNYHLQHLPGRALGGNLFERI